MKFRSLPSVWVAKEEVTIHILCIPGVCVWPEWCDLLCAAPFPPVLCLSLGTIPLAAMGHCKPWQSSVQTSISLTAILIYHSTLFNTSGSRPAVIFQVLQTHQASSFQSHQLKKEPKCTTISSNLAQVSHIFVLISFPGGDLKAVGFLGY